MHPQGQGSSIEYEDHVILPPVRIKKVQKTAAVAKSAPGKLLTTSSKIAEVGGEQDVRVKELWS